MKKLASLALALLLSNGSLAAQVVYHPPSAQGEVGKTAVPPKLVLQLTVDQLRGDLLRRHESSLGEGGFRLLMERGVVFANAHHDHANTETIVGHTTLATGSHPSTHGMIGNLWLDRDSGGAQYNVEDGRYPVLSTKPLVDQATEIDPTQRAAASDGRSPLAILTSTFSDELRLFTGGKGKAFGVSVKDRGAIAMAGHAGTAYWFSKSTGEFVTSSFYSEGYPAWARAWNEAKPTQRYAGQSWSLSGEASGYLFGDRDDRPFETDVAGFGRTFPHPYGAGDGKYFTTLLTLSPAGDELTLDFAKALLVGEELGQDAVPDYLSISFSSTDYVGHVFGPSSLECEENLRRLDRTLAELFQFIDEHVGLSQTLVVLSADHGAPETPEYSRSLGADAEYLDFSDDDKAALDAQLVERFGEGGPLIAGYFHPCVYLDRAAITARGLDADEVAAAVAEQLERHPGIERAVTARAIQSGALPDTRLTRQLSHSYHPRRSGEVYVVTKPGWFVNDFDGLTVASTHGSPWRYDTYVPLVFMGKGLKPQVIQREVHTVDVAASLAALLGTKPPSACEGEPLVELFR